jgi:hypothetical protein
MTIIATLKDENGVSVGVLVLNDKQFASGSRGFHGQGKVEINGKRYQVNFMLVEIGSKAASAEGARHDEKD